MSDTTLRVWIAAAVPPLIATCILTSIPAGHAVAGETENSRSLSAQIAAPAARLPALPAPVSNNAVASVTADGRTFLVSFAGLAAGKEHADTHARTFVYDQRSNSWHEAEPVPGGEGRLASVAVGAAGRAWVFGGYTVAADGSEVSTPWVHAFDPASGSYEQRAPMPVPVDDAVAVVFEDRFIYLVSGWHDYGNVNLVQRYDIDSNEWVQATPVPGPAVFGHAGGIVGNSIVFCDGVAVRPHADRRREFVATNHCYRGIIDESNGRRIDWRKIAAHPGKPRYRMAAAGEPAGDRILFFGGSDNPYNYNGIGYDGNPSVPAAGVLVYELESDSWREARGNGPATMDHRGLVQLDDRWVTVGGMLDGQRVTDRVVSYSVD